MNNLGIADRWRVDSVETKAAVITLHNAEAFEGMRRAGRLAAETLDYITPHVKPGATTDELDQLSHDFIVSRNAVPAPLGYRGFPKSVCTSVNHVVCHGIPGAKRLHIGRDVIEGFRVMLYVVQRGDCESFTVAADIDPGYADALEQAREKGVEAICYGCNISLEGIEIESPLPLAL